MYTYQCEDTYHLFNHLPVYQYIRINPTGHIITCVVHNELAAEKSEN